MYIAMSLYSEEPFPEDIKIKDHVKDYILDFDQAAISGENTFSFMPDEKTFLFNYMEGKFVDDHTFAGMFASRFKFSGDRTDRYLYLPYGTGFHSL